MFNKTTVRRIRFKAASIKKRSVSPSKRGDAKDVVFETGIYNLTQQQTPILVHGEAARKRTCCCDSSNPKTAQPPSVGAPAAAVPFAPGLGDAPFTIPR